MLRFCCLGSGSAGNAWVVEVRAGLFTTRVLVDNGFGPTQLARRLARAGLGFDDLDALLLTHEHDDHVSGAPALLARRPLALLASAGTVRACGMQQRPNATALRASVAVTIGELQALPIAVPHDAAEPLHFVFSDGVRRVAIVTDLGHADAAVARALGGLDALALESNHDAAMLAGSRYPDFLKARIACDRGHLSNDQAAALVRAIPGPAPGRLIAAHLSRSNNTPLLAQQALAAATGVGCDAIAVADQDRGLDWIEV